MKTLRFDDRFMWLAAREGKITGTRLKDVVSVGGPTKEMIFKVLEARRIEFKKTAKKEELEAMLSIEAKREVNSLLPKKIGFYALIAERLGVPDDSENPMERGARLEKEAIERFSEETGKTVDTSLLIWTRDDNDSIAVSPDGVVSEVEAVEVKCLASARHIEAYLTKKVPDDYWFQALQYFIVNDKLEKLDFVCYDPRFVMFVDPKLRKLSLDYFVIEVKREDVQQEVKEYLEYERTVLEQVDTVVNSLTF